MGAENPAKAVFLIGGYRTTVAFHGGCAGPREPATRASRLILS